MSCYNAKAYTGVSLLIPHNKFSKLTGVVVSSGNGIDLEFIISRQDEHHRLMLDKLDKIVDKQVEQGETLVRNTISLEEHIRRTNLLEAQVSATQEDVEDIKEHVDKMKVVGKLLTPTKAKVKWIVTILTALGLTTGGVDLASKDSVLMKIFTEINKTE